MRASEVSLGKGGEGESRRHILEKKTVPSIKIDPISTLCFFSPGVSTCSEAFYMTVGFQTGEEDVEKPEAEKDGRRGQSVSSRAAQFPSDVGSAPVQQHRHGQEGEDGEEGDGEGQRAGLHHKRLPFHVPVNGGHGPGHADAQEDVNGVAAGHVPYGSVCIGVLDGGYLTGEGICRKKTFCVKVSLVQGSC